MYSPVSVVYFIQIYRKFTSKVSNLRIDIFMRRSTVPRALVGPNTIRDSKMRARGRKHDESIAS